MKKFFIFTVIAVLCLSILTGCAGQASTPDFVPYWGQIQTEAGYLEKSTFKISVKTGDDGKPLNKKFDESSSGIYTTILTRVSSDDKSSTYKVENTFFFKGRYNEKPFEDKYTSTVTFKVNYDSFATISSTKDVENYTLLNDDENLAKVSYKITNEYSNKKVKSTITINKDENNILSEIKSTYSGNLKDYFFDNESLFFGIRSLKPNESFSLSSYSLLDPIEQKVLNMQAVFEAQEEDKNKVRLAAIDGAAPAINGASTEEIECNKITTIISGTINKGAPIDLYYSKNIKAKYKVLNENATFENTVESFYYFLVKIEHGDIVYTLNNFDNQAKKVMT